MEGFMTRSLARRFVLTMSTLQGLHCSRACCAQTATLLSVPVSAIGAGWNDASIMACSAGSGAAAGVPGVTGVVGMGEGNGDCMMESVGMA